MRILSIIFSVALAMSVSAQTPLVQQAFDEGTQKAQAGNYENAIENYRKAFILSKSEKTNDDFLARIHLNIGVCLYQLKRNGEAVEELTEAVKLSRRNYQKAFYALGMAHGAMKNWQAAETAFRAAVKLKKDDGEAWFDLALVYLETKDFDAAEKAFHNAVKYKSVNYADAHNNLGVIYALKNDFSAAEKEFKTALIESNGKSREAICNLQFCKLYKQNFSRNLLAKLEFS
ncbi:MAG: tetratricopeptide repeat protein, partial [Acidobacteriota bacterium]|nr:tetratricopeptide repeat protein [Acidobacteriota bacterium]